MRDDHKLSVAILAGGKSRRMGQDKALLELGGRTLLDRVIERAQAVADELLLIGTNRPQYAGFDLRVVPDRLPGSGPLGGVYTALVGATYSHCLVLACDMPFVNVQLLRHMAALPRDYDILAPSLAAGRSDQGGGETLEALHAIYAKSCLAAIEQQLDKRDFKVVSFFSQVRVRRIPEAEVRRIDPQLLSFFNANTPVEYDWALRHARASEGDAIRSVGRRVDL